MLYSEVQEIIKPQERNRLVLPQLSDEFFDYNRVNNNIETLIHSILPPPFFVSPVV